MVKAILTKPLDGMPEGSPREFDQVDFDELRRLGAVREAGDKAAPAVRNKMMPAPANKSAPKD